MCSEQRFLHHSNMLQGPGGDVIGASHPFHAFAATR
jgi:hypothetical protein